MEPPNQTPKDTVSPVRTTLPVQVLSSKRKPFSEEEVFLLLKRIASLPVELALPILYNLDYDSLIAVCDGAKKAQLPKLQNLGFFCDNDQFWNDYIYEQGFDFPKDMPLLFKIIRNKGENNLTVLKDLLFSEEGSQVRKTNLLNAFNERQNKYMSQLELEQAALDLDYIDQQVRDRELRRTGNPRTVIIDIFSPEIISDFPGDISFNDFIQWLVDRDLAINKVGWPVNLTSYWVNVLGGFNHMRKVNPRSHAFELYLQFVDQDLAMLPSLAREGDLVVVKARSLSNSKIRQVQLYYVGPQGMLYPLISHEAGLFFPEIALDFFAKHGVVDQRGVRKLYPDLSTSMAEKDLYSDLPSSIKNNSLLGPYLYGYL